LTGLEIGVIGCGYWGPNLVRTFLEIPGTPVKAVADRKQDRLDQMRFRHPQIEHFFRDYRELIQLDLDAVVVSTPPETHFEIVSAALEQGLDVLVEKPLSTDAASARRLVDLARRHDRILMVGHIGAYNPAVRALKEMITQGELGEIRYIDAVRVGLGSFHPSLNVIWDLAPHDVAIMCYLLDEAPTSVSTRGIACIQDSIEDIAYMTLMFPNGVLAHSRMSWLDPRKTRRITVVGSRKMVVYDDLETHEKLKVYDKRVDTIRESDTFGEYQFAYHYGSVVSPFIHFEEPLRVECLHFIECVANRRQPLTGGPEGVSVVEVVEAAQRSLTFAGAEVRIGDDLEALLELGDAQEPAVGRPSENGVLPQAGLPGASLGQRPASTVDRPDEAQEELILDLSDESSSAAEIDTG